MAVRWTTADEQGTFRATGGRMKTWTWFLMPVVVATTMGCGGKFDGEWELSRVGIDGEQLDPAESPYDGSLLIDANASNATMAWTITEDVDGNEVTVDTLLGGSFRQDSGDFATLQLNGSGTITSQESTSNFEVDEAVYECYARTNRDLTCSDQLSETGNVFVFIR